MKNANRKWMLVLGLAGSLALPGMAMADGWDHAPQKFAGQHFQQRFDRHQRDGDHHYRNHRDHREWRDHRRYDRDAYRRHEWREHRNAYRWHEWREHHDAYRRHEWREHAYYYGHPVYPRAHLSGFFAYPSVGLMFNMH